MTTTNLTPKTPSDINLAEITVEGLSYPDHKKTDRRRGFCACCGRTGFLLNKKGRLSRHGFTRPRFWGVTIGECQGSGMKPQDTVKVAIQLLTDSIENLTEVIENEALLVSTFIKQWRDRRRSEEKERTASSYWRTQSMTVKRGTIIRGRDARTLRSLRTVQRLGVMYGNFGTYSPERDAQQMIERFRDGLWRQRQRQMDDLALMKTLQSNVEALAA